MWRAVTVQIGVELLGGIGVVNIASTDAPIVKGSGCKYPFLQLSNPTFDDGAVR